MTDTPQQEIVRHLFDAANAEIGRDDPAAAREKIERALALAPMREIRVGSDGAANRRVD